MKKIKTKKRSKSELTKLKEELWKWFAMWVKLQIKPCRCYTCGKELEIGTSNCQCGHCLPKKAYPALYFDENNCRPQCYYCNINLGGNGAVFSENLKKEIGEAIYEEMYSRRHNQIKWTRSDYEEKIELYKNKVKQCTLNE